MHGARHQLQATECSRNQTRRELGTSITVTRHRMRRASHDEGCVKVSGTISLQPWKKEIPHYLSGFGGRKFNILPNIEFFDLLMHLACDLAHQGNVIREQPK